VELTYSKHARLQMLKRKITEEDVELALSRTTGDRPGQPGTLWLHGMATGGRILSVGVTLADRRFVVTAA
jgi:Domain of unknown function (DUF4258)